MRTFSHFFFSPHSFCFVHKEPLSVTLAYWQVPSGDGSCCSTDRVHISGVSLFEHVRKKEKADENPFSPTCGKWYYLATNTVVAARNEQVYTPPPPRHHAVHVPHDLSLSTDIILRNNKTNAR